MIYFELLDQGKDAVGSKNVVPGIADCSCSPTKTRVFLDNDQSHLGVLWPNQCLTTQQCGGGCLLPEYQECRPIKKRIDTHTRIFVYLQRASNGMQTEPKQFNVEYHETCGCQCKKKQCHPKMEFIDRYCSCYCKPEYSPEKIKCVPPYEVSKIM